MEDEIIAGRKALAFTQTPQWILLSGISARAVQLYDLYTMHVNTLRGDRKVWPSRAFLAWVMGYSEPKKVDRYNKELVKLGAIDITKRRSPNGWSNVVTVHETPPEGYAGSKDLTEHYLLYRQVQGG